MRKCVGVTDNYEFHSRTSDSHIHTAQVAQESDVVVLVVSHHADNYNVAFLALKSVNGVSTDVATQWVEETLRTYHTAQQTDLPAIGRYDAERGRIVY